MDVDDLVTRIQQGEHDLAPLLVSMLAPGLLGYAATVAPDLGDADLELICETALEDAARRIARFDRTVGPFQAWVLPFVRHAASDLRRRRRGTTQEPLVELPDDRSAAPAFPTDLELRRSAALSLLVARLGETDQLMLALRHGTPPRSWAEIAAELDVPETALRQRHSRALVRLRALAAHEPDLPH